MSANPEMRPELAAILSARYGDQRAATAISIVPREIDVQYYERHNGRLSLPISLIGDPHLIVIDTGRLIHLKYGWINQRYELGFTVNLASDNQQVSKKIQQSGSFNDMRVEGVEITVHYGNQHREIPYSDELKPLY